MNGILGGDTRRERHHYNTDNMAAICIMFDSGWSYLLHFLARDAVKIDKPWSSELEINLRSKSKCSDLGILLNTQKHLGLVFEPLTLTRLISSKSWNFDSGSSILPGPHF